MPIETYWYDDEKTLLIYDFKGTWTLEEFHAAIDNVTVMLAGFAGRLDIISDMSNARMERGVSASATQAAWGRSYKIMPDNYELAIVVGAGMMLEFFIRTFGKVYAPIRDHVRAAGTLEEAVQLIKTDRSKETQP